MVTTERISGRLYSLQQSGLTHTQAVNAAQAARRNIRNWDQGRGRSGHKFSVRVARHEGMWAIWLRE